MRLRIPAAWGVTEIPGATSMLDQQSRNSRLLELDELAPLRRNAT
jgi:hypothetical protein